MEWDELSSLRLIDYYRQNKLLWNSKYPDHFNKAHRNLAWEHIARNMGISAEECKKKMSILLASMRREKAKLKKSLQSGTDEEYKSTWFAFKSLQFMWDKDLQLNYTNADKQEDSEEEEEEEEVQSGTPPPEVTPSRRHMVLQKRHRRLKGSSSSQKAMHERASKRDSSAVYGEFVGESIRNLQNKRLQSWARHQINNVLYLAEQAFLQNQSELPSAEHLNITLNPGAVFPTANLSQHIAALNRGISPPKLHGPKATSPAPSIPDIKNSEMVFKEEPSYSNPSSPAAT